MSERKPRKWKVGSKNYVRTAIELALTRCPPIYPCVGCHAPVIDGYVCWRCGCEEPTNPDAEAFTFDMLAGSES